MSKQRSYRVPPEYVQALIAFVNTEEVKVSWKQEHDAHTLFEGSAQAINIVRAFIKGFDAANTK